MSEESEEEEEFVGFFTNDSDSDMSDHLMDSQELEPGFTGEGKNSAVNKLRQLRKGVMQATVHKTLTAIHQSLLSILTQVQRSIHG